MALTFALVGLYLYLEKGQTGREVQQAHMRLARRKQTWPAFDLPASRGTVTPNDVMAAPPGTERDAAIERWCASVWAAYAHHRRKLEDLLRATGAFVVT
jgi:hypothetical protein